MEASNIEHLEVSWVFLEEVQVKCVKIGANLKPSYANYGWPLPSGFRSPYDREYELLVCGTKYCEKHQDQALGRRLQLGDTTVQ